MSGYVESGQGTLLKNIRAGNRPAFDPRNRLILPALDVIRELRPRWVVFENVIEMRNTMIDDGDRGIPAFLSIVFDRLSPEYDGHAFDVEMADYGIPQRRQRLITVMTRDPQALEAYSSGSRSCRQPRTPRWATRALKRVGVGHGRDRRLPVARRP